MNPNWNKPQTVYLEAGRVRGEEKRIGKGKDEKEYRRHSLLSHKVQSRALC